MCMCVYYHTLNSLLPHIVKAHSNAQGILSLVPLPMIDDLYAMLNGSTAYSSLYYTSGYHYFELFPKAQKKSAFTTLISKFSLSLSFEYLDDILIFTESTEKHLKHLSLIS